MHISRDEHIAGHPAFGIRKLLRFARDYGEDLITVGAASRILRVDQSVAQRLFRRLQREGYLESPFRVEKVWLWRLTAPKGLALCSATAHRPILRKTADRLLQQVMQRVHAINASPQFMWKITCLVVFGSYLSDCERLGDLDLAFQPKVKIEDPAELRKQLQAQLRQAETAGRRFRTPEAFSEWLRNNMWLALKSGSRAISLHELRPPQDDWIFSQQHRILLGTRPTMEDQAIWA